MQVEKMFYHLEHPIKSLSQIKATHQAQTLHKLIFTMTKKGIGDL